MYPKKEHTIGILEVPNDDDEISRENNNRTYISKPCLSEEAARNDLILQSLSALFTNLKWKSVFMDDCDRYIKTPDVSDNDGNSDQTDL